MKDKNFPTEQESAENYKNWSNEGARELFYGTPMTEYPNVKLMQTHYNTVMATQGREVEFLTGSAVIEEITNELK